jgi:p21-activated kinase 1
MSSPVALAPSTPSAPSPTSYRPAPAPPTAAQPTLDRSTSQRTPTRTSKSQDLGRANTTRARHSPSIGASHAPVNTQTGAPNPPPKPFPGSSQSDLTLKGTQPPRDRDPRAVQQAQQPSPAVASLAKTAGVATPRRREKKDKDKDGSDDIIKRLQQICTDADPTKLYRNLVKIGQG